MYIFAVALEDGRWHHVESYLPARAARASTVTLWKRIRTLDDPEWTRRYHAANARDKAFGGRVIIKMNDGTVIEDEIAVADAHPMGARPFGRDDYIAKFHALSGDYAASAEREGFLEAALALPMLGAGTLDGLNIEVPPEARHCEGLRPGIFEQSSKL